MTAEQQVPQGKLKYYPPAEERINIVSHGLGLLLSIVGLLALVTRAVLHGGFLDAVSASVFGISMIAVYTSSTAYHATTAPLLRTRLRTVDHAVIYLLIAGTYTPVTLLTLNGAVGWTIFGITWTLAAIGVGLKLFFTGHYDRVSTLMYVFMGWLIVFFIKPLIESMPFAGLMWLLAGGMAYTVGAVLYSISRLPFNHALFHLFVLLGSICHFVAVYRYVLPSP